MEQILFRDYETRLQFDDGLLRMRAEFEVHKEKLRGTRVHEVDMEDVRRFRLRSPSGQKPV